MYQEQINAKTARVAEIDGLLSALQEERAQLETELAELGEEMKQALPRAVAFVQTNLAAIREYSGQLADHLEVIMDTFAVVTEADAPETFQEPAAEVPAPPVPQG